jgi:predicted esterase
LGITEHSIKIERTAHYYTSDTNLKDARHIWLLLHGYGQLASRLIKRFTHKQSADYYFIAPEAISKYYVRRQPNVVGASWMSQEHRLDEIADYINYISKVMDPIIQGMHEGQKLNILGFSQGTSTMWRYINHNQYPYHTIVNWAGEFPKDIEFSDLNDYLQNVPHKYFCVGDNDEYITPEFTKKIKKFINENKFGFKFKLFEGTHVIDQDVFREILAEVFE